MSKQSRPVYLNVFKLGFKMPITGKISILHRISGVIMFLCLPLIVGIFHRSLIDGKFAHDFFALATRPFMKVVYLVLIWGLMHHLFAGIRFIFIDNHQGIDKVTSKKTAWAVLVISLLITIALGATLWLNAK